jgi:formylglycine-generating enzyme required for sulfatase activity
MQVTAETLPTPSGASSVPSTTQPNTAPAATVTSTVKTDDATLAHDANAALAVKDYATAISKFTSLAERGNTVAQFNLGVFYLNGQGVPKDDKQGYGWIKKAALAGKANARKVLENAAASGNLIAIAELKDLQQATSVIQPVTPEAVAPASPASSADGTKKRDRLVLMPLRVSDEDSSALGSMETALVQGLKEKYEVFSGEQVSQKAREIFLKESRATSATHKNCDETRCMQDIAEAFQAELIATSNVTRREDGFLLAISIQNIFDNKVVFSNSIACRNCDVYQVIDKLKELSNSAVATQQAETTFRDCPTCPEMAIIPTGNFYMGGNGKAEMPIHLVTIPRSFALGKTEITQGQWKELMGTNPSEFKECGDNCPVEKVSWDDALQYIAKLNAKTGKQYRLPSEAEWEYACRAGAHNDYCGGDNINNIAWYSAKANANDAGSGNVTEFTHAVGKKQANAFGLFDMSGNVWEWTQDSAAHTDYNGAPADGSVWQGDSDYKILRGGSWFHSAKSARAETRGNFKADSRNGCFGFRIAISR